jgi:4'-phosphopantetheinyl transferase
MPLLLTKAINPHSAYAVWRISETTPHLKTLVKEDVPDMIASKQAEWIVTRILISYLCSVFELPYEGTVSTPEGKPILVNTHAQISITHSYPYAAAMLSRQMPCGIDLEIPRQKMVHVKDKFLHASEIDVAGSDIEKLCKIWAAKEVMYKIHGRKALSLRDDLKVVFNGDLDMTGYYLNGVSQHPVRIKLEKVANYILAYNY